MSLDLSAVQTWVEDNIMHGQIIITRDDEGLDDDIFSHEDGSYTVVGQDTRVLYDGPYFMAAVAPDPLMINQGEGVENINTYNFFIKMDGLLEPLQKYDIVTVKISEQDPLEVDQVFVVNGSVFMDFGVLRWFTAQWRDPNLSDVALS